MQEVFKVLQTAGATAQSLRSLDNFRTILVNFAQQENVKNGIWNACLSSMRS